MSEKSKGDNATSRNIVKNPLLSSAVTGLTFDDFPNNPLLLPAAPPIVHAPVLVPGIISRDTTKSLVTVGNTSAIDTENLDEINLNATTEETPAAVIDPNSNPLLEQNFNNNDSILSQAASSFSSLPSVASSVFSTFSKRIYSGSTSRERTPEDSNANPISQLDIQPSYIGQQQPHTFEQAPAAVPPPFYAPPPPTGGNYFASTPSAPTPPFGEVPAALQSNLVASEPPKFYTPAEVPALPTLGAIPPPSSGQNTFRLAAKKKIYAPIPGFSDQSAQQQAALPTVDPSVNASLAFDSSQAQPYPYSYSQADPFTVQQQPAQPKPEERKGGLFSLTNLVPTGVLQNITGLVQSAAGTLTQSVKSDTTQSSQQYSQPYQAEPQGNINYFGAPPSAGFYPTSLNDQTINQPTQPIPFYAPPPPCAVPFQQSQPLVTGQSTLAFAQPPKCVTPEVVEPLLPATNQGQYPPKISQLPVENFGTQPSTIIFNPIQDCSQLTAPPSQPIVYPQTIPTAIGFVDPTKPAVAIYDPTQPITQTSLGIQPLPTATSEPPLSSVSPSSLPVIDPQTIVTGIGSFESTKPAVALFDPSQSQSVASISVGVPPTISHLPPNSVIAPPTNQAPPTVSGQTSFRLQKGTRHYKNPLTAAETAPTYANQPLAQLQAVQSSQSQQLPVVFNPLVTSSNESNIAGASRNSVLTPTSNFFVPNISTEAQSVQLFAAEDPKPPLGSNSFFNPAVQVYQESPDPISFFNTAEQLQKEPEPSSGPIGFFNPGEQLPVGPKPPSGSTEFPYSAQQLLGEPEPSSGPIEFFNPVEQLISSATTIVAQQSVEVSTDATNAVANSTASLDGKQPELPLTELKPVELFAIPTAIESVTEQLLINPNEANIGSIEDQTIDAVLPEETKSHASEETSQFHNIDPLEQTIKELSLQSEVDKDQNLAASFLPPPPHSFAANEAHSANPYRKGLTATTQASAAVSAPPAVAAPSLAHFFTPTASDTSAAGDFNFFALEPTPTETKSVPANTTSAANFFSAPQPPTIPVEKFNIFPALPTQSGIVPLALTREPPISSDITETVQPTGIAPPPLGFDNIVTESLVAAATTADQTSTAVINEPEIAAATTENTSSLNSFSNYFNQTLNFGVQQQQQKESEPVPVPKLVDPKSFFDSFATQSTTNATAPPTVEVTCSEQRTNEVNEDQRIQNFFNNPPPKENGGGIGDLNYDLVHRGLGIQTRPLTPASNLVEPPSSSCSEWSELNNSTAAQKVALETAAKVTVVGNQNTVSPVKSTTSATSLESNHYKELPEEILHALRMANLVSTEKGAVAAPIPTVSYAPAVKHWFFKRLVGTKLVWLPFSHYDSALLETSFSDAAPSIVAVEGGRYDVNISERIKTPVYWEGEPIEVRRCSWFYKATDSKYVPYEEETADLLEAEYKAAADSGEWHKKIILSMGEQVVFHGPTVIVHFQQQQNSDAWGGTTSTSRPRVVKRDLDDFIIEPGESQRVDHLLFMVHGIGAACDLKMRSVEEVVDEFRSIAQQLVQSHYKNSTDMGLVGRVEVLPISWHGHLHSEEMGIDDKLKSITLESIPKLRNFTNDTLLDVLFYTSPTYCQKIMNTVAASMNSVYVKYRQRQPDFNGGVSLAGHSLGSLIVFDLLCHQNPIKECEDQNMENPDQQFSPPQTPAMDSNLTATTTSNNVAAKQISYTMGPAGTGQPFIHYAQLIFQPKKFFALGSPIGMFVTIRGIDKLGLDFRLPTCAGFYNIFHPFDPVAYRIEALVNPDMSGIRPVLIPHHKGRKRMHLELKETMTRVGADIKQRFFDTFKTSVNFLSTSRSKKEEAEETMEKEVDKVIALQMQLEQQQRQELEDQSSSHTLIRPRADSNSTTHSDTEAVEIDLPLGKLNDSKRVDYVLQEAPLEFFNEYLFALSSHVCYWESEDTILFVMKEIYTGLGVSPDSQVPQQNMSIERPSSRNSNTQTFSPPPH